MNLRDLEYLVALAEHRHFGKAARASFATQPTVSLQLRKLERELGAALIERTSRKVLLTALGLKVADRARAVLQRVREIEDLARQERDPFAGDVRLGLFPTLAPYLLPRIVPGLTHRHPKLRPILAEEKTPVLLARLREGALDAALLALPVRDNAIESRFLFEEEFLLAVAASRGWPGGRSVRRSQLKGHSLLLLEEGHCLRDQALEFCASSGARELPDFRASSLETLRQMVAAGVGMTLMPAIAARAGDGIEYIPFEKPKPSRRIGISWRRSSARKELLVGLHCALRQILQAQGRDRPRAGEAG